jgi:hypothetical protein
LDQLSENSFDLIKQLDEEEESEFQESQKNLNFNPP